MYRHAILLALLTAAPAVAQPKADPAKLTLDRIFASDDFKGDRVPSVKWLDGGAYTTRQPSKAHKGASDLVKVDAAGKSEVLDDAIASFAMAYAKQTILDNAALVKAKHPATSATTIMS